MISSNQPSVIKEDFQPFNKWKVDKDGPKFFNGEPRNIIDQTTGRKYFNESKTTVGFKCFLVTLGTPIVHTIASLLNVAWRILKLVTLSHFWVPQKGNYNFTARAKEAGKDLLRIVVTPLAIIALELSAIYGIIRPYDGRKLYASCERALYNHFILAPCFQPSPTQHLLGGDTNKQNAF